MKKKLVLAACMIACACACQPRAASQNGNGNGQSDDQNFQDRRKQQAPRPQGGCCETEKPQAAPQAASQAAPQVSQTAATPEIKVEKAQ